MKAATAILLSETHKEVDRLVQAGWKQVDFSIALAYFLATGKTAPVSPLPSKNKSLTNYGKSVG